MLKKTALFVLIILTVCFSQDENKFQEENNVLVLTQATFDKAVEQFEFLVVEFYAPWCGHCKSLEPEYAKAASILREQKPNLRLAKVDATAESILAEKFQIEGYPTLKLIINGSIHEFQGGRTASEIVEYLIKRTGPPYVKVDSDQQVQTHREQSDVVVLFIGSESEELFQVYDFVAKQHEDLTFLYSNELQTQYPTKLVLFRGQEQFNFEGEFAEEQIADFIASNEFSLVFEFNEKGAQRIFGGNVPTLILFYENDNQKSVEAVQILKDVAADISKNFYLAISQTKEDMGQRLAEFIGVQTSDVPAVKIVVPQDEDVLKYTLEQEISKESLVQFVTDYWNDKLTPTFKSEEIPETQNEAVLTVVGKNFHQIVMDESVDVLVEFYAPWCGHCKSLAPIYEAFAAQKKLNTKLIVAKIDATANEVPGQNIQGFPTIIFYPASDKSNPITYEEDRTSEGLQSFYEQHSSFDKNGNLKQKVSEQTESVEKTEL